MDAYDVGSKVLGGWELVRLIGQGGFGSVFEAEKSGFGLTVKSAVKVVRIPPSQSMVTSALSEGMDEASVIAYFGGLVEDFMGEVVLLSSLGHPGVVAYHDHEVVRDEQGVGWTILLRMELLECLTERVLREPLSYDEVLRLGEEVADVLAYCHEHKIIHRDVKPENVFVDAEGRFKLGDFGVSRVVEGTSGTLSQKGTLAYMAPELYRGGHYDESVDVYSLGLMLYRFLNSGRLPFLPPAPAPITFADRNQASARRMAGEEIPRPEGCDDATFSVVKAACTFDPASRPSAAVLRDALRGLREQAAPAAADETTSSFTSQSLAKATEQIEETAKGQVTAPDPGISPDAGSLTSQGTVGVWDVFGGSRAPQATSGPASVPGDGSEPQMPGDAAHSDSKPENSTPLKRIPIAMATFEPIPTQLFNGCEVCPEVRASYGGTPLQEGVDYLVTYYDNTAPGEARARLKGLGRFKGVKTLSFTIEGKKGVGAKGRRQNVVSERIPISKAAFEPIPTQPFKGGEARPEVMAFYDGEPLLQGVDYSVTYDANAAPGEAKVRLKGLGRFKGVKTLPFSVGGKPTSANLNAIAKRYFEKRFSAWDREHFGETVFGPGVTYTKAYKARKSLGVKEKERIYLLCDTTWFKSVKRGFACCTTGIYCKGELGSERPEHGPYMSWNTFRKLPTDAIPGGNGGGISIDGATFASSDGKRLREILWELREELNDPRNWAWAREGRARREGGIQNGIERRSDGGVRKFLQSYVRHINEGSPKGTSTLGHHDVREELCTRTYLSISRDEDIYAIHFGYEAVANRDKEPYYRLGTIAITECGLYVPKKTVGGHTVKLVPLAKLPHFVQTKLVYKEGMCWIYFDDDELPFAFYDDFKFWKGLFDGLANMSK